jgi:hypothetical protein
MLAEFGHIFRFFLLLKRRDLVTIILHVAKSQFHRSGVRQFIGEQFLLTSFFYIVNLKRATELISPVLCDIIEKWLTVEEYNFSGVIDSLFFFYISVKTKP